MYGTCTLGQQGQIEGTCYPLPTGPADGTGPAGICFEAGRVPEGEACNTQSFGRDAAGRVQQCAPGTICVSDPDGPLDPTQNWDSTGECGGLCDPRAPSCSNGRTCADISDIDDQTTPQYNEARAVGLCVESDCQMGGGNACGAGRQCRPYSLLAPEGKCGPAGNAATGEAGTGHADCADEVSGGDPGGGAVCLQTCTEAGPACPDGTMCVVQDRWAFGVCLAGP